ncbi:unnamed protein product [Phaedon cochleariae]|uniref:Uncharacterized protein n=1 Tax=Phaedon cochleariae TaxID=80249 RepID=A0A9P0DIF4_PHACE|nr:unnamed protein product [Phaedon cochleariae]
MVKMSRFNNYRLLFLMIIVICLADSKNVTNHFNGTSPQTSLHLSQSMSIPTHDANLPEEKLPQHKGREHVQYLSDSKVAKSTTNKPEEPQKIEHIITTIEGSNSVSEPGVLLLHKNRTSSQVTANITVTKNVTQVKIHSTTNKPSTKPTKVKPHKPIKTVHDDMPASTGEKPEMLKADISNIDDSLNKKSKRANYIIPIVAVILSVPLVTIIISVLYKRGKDWWQHRNYRRMDYLIEGMYNS